jgi:hypothetical protein
VVTFVAPAAGFGADGDEGVDVVAAPAWLTVNDRPAMVSVPERAAPVFAAALYVRLRPPVPLDGVTLNHVAPEAAVQAQLVLLAVSAMLPLPPPAATDPLDGESVNVHPAPSWLIVNVLPATVSVPLRAADEPLAATVATTVPLPVPPAVLNTTQETLDFAVHAQLDPVVTLTCVPPPAAGREADVPDSE